MSAKPVRFLIAEDDPHFAEVVKRVIDPLRAGYPNCSVTVVQTLDALLEQVVAMPVPEAVMLDLTMPPHSMQDALDQLDFLEDIAPVVIVTGKSEDQVRAIIGKRSTPVVEKFPHVTSFHPGFLVGAIEKAILFFHERKWRKIYAEIDALKKIPTNAP